jgi:predicted acyl esterase
MLYPESLTEIANIIDILDEFRTHNRMTTLLCMRHFPQIRHVFEDHVPIQPQLHLALFGPRARLIGRQTPVTASLDGSYNKLSMTTRAAHERIAHFIPRVAHSLLSAQVLIALGACSPEPPAIERPSSDDSVSPTEADSDPPDEEPAKPSRMDAGRSTTSQTGRKDGGAVVRAADGGAPDAGPGFDGATSPPDSAVLTSSDPSPATKTWWAYDRPATYTVLTSTVQVPTRDGTKLNCKLYQPAQDGVLVPGKLPGLVVEFTPYPLQADQYAKEAAYFVTRGYNALVCTLRGVGGSGGEWQHAFSRQDGRDASDLVEWLAVQPYSDGRIGVFGESYGGQTTYGAAVEAPPHLRAIAPMQSPANLYDDVLYPGGIRSVPGGSGNFWPIIAQLMSFGAISADAEYASDGAHPTYDTFWQERALIGRYGDIKVPVLAFGGWIDNFFRSGMLHNVEGALDKTWVIYGQWVHTIPVDLGTCENQCAPDPVRGGIVLAWFDHWVMELKDVPIPAQPTFLSFEGGAKDHARGWQELSKWVPEGTAPLAYQLGSDGTLAEIAVSSAPLKFHQPAEADVSGGALTFSTPALDADRVLLGHPLLDFRATLSATDANFYVTLLDVDAMGTETLVNDGYLRASHRTSHTTPSPVPAGQAIDYHIEVRAQHYRFVAGHRVRIRLWGGAKDVLEQTASVDVTVDTGTHATLSMPGFRPAP